LCCLSFDLRILITPLVSSNSFYVSRLVIGISGLWDTTPPSRKGLSFKTDSIILNLSDCSLKCSLILPAYQAFPKCTMDSSLLLLTGMWGIKFTPNIKMHLQVLLLLCLVPNVSRVSGLSIFDCPFSFLYSIFIQIFSYERHKSVTWLYKLLWM
jgi:hypothetical protein